MKQVALIVILLFVEKMVGAQPDIGQQFAPVSIKMNRNADTVVDLTAATYLLAEDDIKGTKENIQEILKNRFVPLAGQNFRYIRRAGYIRFWIRFNINNTGDDTLRTQLYFGKHWYIKLMRINPVDLSDSTIGENGFTYYSDITNRLHAAYHIPVMLPPDSTCYFVAELAGVGKMMESIIPTLYVGNSYYVKAIRDSNVLKEIFPVHLLLLGGIFVLAIFNLAQFFTHRDKSYLYYACYAICVFLYIARSHEYNQDMRIISQYFPLYFYYSVPYYTFGSALFYFLFVRSFLGDKLKYMYIFKLTSALIVVLSVIVFFHFVLVWIAPQNPLLIMLDFCMTLLPFIGMAIVSVLLVLKVRKNVLTAFLFVGSLFLLTGGFIQVYLNNFEAAYMSRFFPPVTYLEIGVLLELFFFALGLGHKKKLLEKEKKEAELKKIAVEVQALRSQMNPHFIFNCLNSIKLYAAKNDGEAAANYVTKFSKLIRQMLENGRNEKITLKAELEALELYIQMEGMRFKERLQYTISVNKSIDTEFIELPPMLIQPYVENAIWHGLMHRETGGRIAITVTEQATLNQLIVTISDNGIGRVKANELKSRTAAGHRSYGIKVTAERIELINRISPGKIKVHITDLYDDNGAAAGTEVRITLSL